MTKTLKVSTPEHADALSADITRNKILLTKLTAEHEADVAKATKAFDARTANLRDRIQNDEVDLQDFCTAYRQNGVVFGKNKSRETTLARYGFRTTPWRVETANKKIKWKDACARMLRTAWAKVYVRDPEPKVDKQALLADRQSLTPEQLREVGISFEQDEIFFHEPKPETAQLQTN